MNKYSCDNIYQADSYEAIKELPDKSIDLIITDIPYDVSVNHGAGAFGVKKKLHYEQFVSISNGIDLSILDEFVRVMKKINIYIWCSLKQILPISNYFVGKYNCYWNIITWHKTNPCPTCNNKYMPDTEFCLFFREKGVPLYGDWKSKTTHYETPLNVSDKKKYGHPTIKPIAIINNFIINSSKEGDVVFDPFVGSGTTCVGAKINKRQYIGFDIESKYIEIAKDRLNNIDKDGQMSMFTN